jgi:hypothetical protein
MTRTVKSTFTTAGLRGASSSPGGVENGDERWERDRHGAPREPNVSSHCGAVQPGIWA